MRLYSFTVRCSCQTKTNSSSPDKVPPPPDWKSQVVDFTQDTSLHGIRHVTSAGSRLIRRSVSTYFVNVVIAVNMDCPLCRRVYCSKYPLRCRYLPLRWRFCYNVRKRCQWYSLPSLLLLFPSLMLQLSAAAVTIILSAVNKIAPSAYYNCHFGCCYNCPIRCYYSCPIRC